MMLSPLYFYISMCPLFIKMPVIIFRAHPNPVKPKFNLTNYKDPTSKSNHIVNFHMDM